MMNPSIARAKSGPLNGKKIALIAGSEFSDFQAYYLLEYLSEFGGEPECLVISWPEASWKWSRPHMNDGTRGTFGLPLNPVPTMAPGERYNYKTFTSRDELQPSKAREYDAVVVLGGHSADVIRTETPVTQFVKEAFDNGAVVAGLECGPMVLMSAGIVHGQNVTGYKVIKTFLGELGTYHDVPVVRDGNLITARDSDATAEFTRELCRAFDPHFPLYNQDVLKGKRIVIIAGQDFEDVELCVPAMEFSWRGAEVILGTFPAPVVSRPPMLGLDVVMGNFGMSVPFQELKDESYVVRPLRELSLTEFDAIMIPGAFCPWHCIEDEYPVDLVKRSYHAGKVIAAICHGPLVFAAADLVRGKNVAAYAACSDDLKTMGANYDPSWPAVIDGNMVTARVPDDVPEFVDAITDALTGIQ